MSVSFDKHRTQLLEAWEDVVNDKSSSNCVHFSVLVSKNLQCSGNDCKRNFCPASCSCLGTFVDCSRRGLTFLPNDLPLWVEILDLQYNNISFIIDSALDDLKNLTKLDLSNNNLSYLNASAFIKLNSLQSLIINKNNLKEMPDFSYLSRLRTLSLEENKIRTLPDCILEDFKNLHALDLSFNDIEYLSANTFCNSSIYRLSLSHNNIVSIEKGVFDNLTALEYLKLNRNRLSYIPKDVLKPLNTLRYLEINANNLTRIEGLSFQGLVSLSVLKLRHSHIFNLADGAFYGLSSIKKLQLDYNNISIITKGWLYGLTSLQRLYLNHNNISQIEEDAWDSGKRLLELDMTNNKLQYILSKTFEKLHSLKRLILSDNYITYIEEGAFQSLSALQYLELKNNEISWTIEDTGNVFSGLERLKYLGVSQNKIKAIVKRAFTGMPRLETLNLTDNPIITIQKDAFGELPRLENVALNTSILLCDCNLLWMTKFKMRVVAKCGYPERLKGLSLFELDVKDFQCDGLPKPVLTKEPVTKITLRGENVTLDCEAKSSGISNVVVHWRKDGKLLQGIRLWSKSITSIEDGFAIHSSWLFIERIQDKDEGHYQCVVSNRFGSAYSNKARITVHVLPVFTKTPVDVAITAGSTARLECGATGHPQPDISWRKDKGGEDFPAARERRMHVMPTDDIFFIVKAKASDSGVYSCTAQNVAGVITANATLTVLETPSFVKKMEDKETRAGETAVLECMASGSPKPNLTWTKDGGHLIATERHFFTAGNQLLIIVQSKPSDSGEYTCTMSNSLATIHGSSTLKVLSPILKPEGELEDNNVTGIIVIAVVVCVVGTSIIWVIVIHRTRKTRDDFASASGDIVGASADVTSYNPYRSVCPKDLKQSTTNIYLDSHSGHSKDSGTGDSVQPSSADLLLEAEDQELLRDLTLLSKRGVGHLLALQNNMLKGKDSSCNSSVSKEQVPLLHSRRTSHSSCNHRQSIAEFRQHPIVDRCVLTCDGTKRPCILVHRSLSADQLTNSEVMLCHQSGCELLRDVNSDSLERDSNFSTFPRSVIEASVSNWSTESRMIPKDIPNDSGNFSIGSDVQTVSIQDKCI